MRFASLVIVFTMAGAARAQTGANASDINKLFGWGGAPRQINFVPVDTSKAIMPMPNISRAMRPPSSQANSPLSFSGIFPKISMPSWPPKTAQVSVLPQTQNIYQPAPPQGGVNLFNFSPNAR